MTGTPAVRLVFRRAGQLLDRFADWVWEWDEELVETVSGARILQKLDAVWRAATYLGYGYLWAALALALILFGTKADHAAVLVGLGIIIVAVFLSQAGKSVARRPRPTFHRRGFHHRLLTSTSFPSNHTAAAFAMAHLVVRLYPWWPNVAVIYTTAAAIGLSRVYLREHYLLDVLGGAILGTAVSHGLLPLLARLVQ